MSIPFHQRRNSFICPSVIVVGCLVSSFLFGQTNPTSREAGTTLGSYCADTDDATTSQECQPNAVPDAARIQTRRIPELANRPTFPPSRSNRTSNSQFSPASEVEQVRPPEPATEFQMFVNASTGHMLPIFGTWLFNSVPSTFAPVDHIPVSADYVLGPGDEINLRIWGQISADEKLVVDRQGNVFVPQVGRVNVIGLPFSRLSETLKTNIGRVFRNFELSVDMGDLRSIQVFVMGRAHRPGSYTVSSLSTLVNALFASGGPSPEGSMRSIQVRRSGRTVTTFDLYDLLLHGDKSKDIALQPGDVIFIPSAGPRVAIAGSVETAAIYEIGVHNTLGDVLAFAGGPSSIAAAQQVVLQRVNHRSTLESQNVDLDDTGLCTPVQDGDIISLLQVVPKFEKTVAVKGNVADPVRLPWRPGMKISDAIPDKQALLTRDYWREHNRLSSGSAGFKEIAKARDSSLAAAVSGDKTAVTREFRSKNDVQLSAPEINWKYAAIERQDPQTLATRLLAFDLGKVVIDKDATEDLALEPGDVITIFSSADFVTPQAEQTRFVRLEGEVKMAGIYSAKPGDTLRDLIIRAGGLTEKAYVYGAQFTRESTRREQEKRLSDYVDRVEREMDNSSSGLAGQTISAEQEATLRLSMQSQRVALERLRDRAATGRIVLALKPEMTGPESFPPLPLENGDRLVIPSTPSTVSVIGTVYNESTFLHRPELDVKSCLQEAGGPTRYADRTHTFIIRADGSVVSKGKHSGFDTLPVYPGDTIVVPTNALKSSKTRSLLEASQMASGFGLSAAALTALHP